MVILARSDEIHGQLTLLISWSRQPSSSEESIMVCHANCRPTSDKSLQFISVYGIHHLETRVRQIGYPSGIRILGLHALVLQQVCRTTFTSRFQVRHPLEGSIQPEHMISGQHSVVDSLSTSRKKIPRTITTARALRVQNRSLSYNYDRVVCGFACRIC